MSESVPRDSRICLAVNPQVMLILEVQVRAVGAKTNPELIILTWAVRTCSVATVSFLLLNRFEALIQRDFRNPKGHRKEAQHFINHGVNGNVCAQQQNRHSSCFQGYLWIEGVPFFPPHVNSAVSPQTTPEKCAF